jgi:hypothetical protein
MIKPQAIGENSEASEGGSCDVLRPFFRLRRCKAGKVVGGFPVGQPAESSCQLHHIATGITAGEAPPDVFFEADHESPGVVPAVDRARSSKTGTPPGEPIEQPPVGQHLLDGDLSFEKPEVEI